MIDEEALNIYTDGSSIPKPRRGGIGIRYIFCDEFGNEIYENLSWPGYLGATNNEMELNAVIIALKKARPYLINRKFNRIIVFSDSQYIIENEGIAFFVWPKNKWLKRTGAPVLNAKLWKELNKIRRNIGIRIEFIKVKGHSSDVHNKAVDRLAKKSANNPRNKPISIRTVRRKKSKKITEIGSVKTFGQRLTIRIIEGQYLEVQKIYRYRYEVMSKASPFFGNVDFIVSIEILKEGHIYYVKLNEEPDNPRIVKIYKEVSN
jgi:ribonuclease HI